MRIFVTGASGYIGTAVSHELIEGGHQVLGLARSDESAEKMEAAGVEPLRGSLSDLDSLAAGARDADGVIHLAFQNISPTTDFVAAGITDLEAIQTMGSVLEGTGKPLVITSGTLVFSSEGRLALETDVLDIDFPRVNSENATVAMAERGIRSAVIRLAPSVHGVTDMHGFIPRLIEFARANGVSPYVGSGDNRWPGIHVLDAARLYRLAVESAPAGSRFHGVGEVGVPFREIAASIGRHLGVPVESLSEADAAGHFTFLTWFVGLDNPTSNEWTSKTLGWRPVGPSLLEDIDAGFYFSR
jgi:nucleoside-diphosphate-sugar epimerase